MGIQRKELEWAELPRAYEESGKSLHAFSEERGLSKSSLYGRVRELRKSSCKFIEQPKRIAEIILTSSLGHPKAVFYSEELFLLR